MTSRIFVSAVAFVAGFLAGAEGALMVMRQREEDMSVGHRSNELDLAQLASSDQGEPLRV
jgi:hypothetical protein